MEKREEPEFSAMLDLESAYMMVPRNTLMKVEEKEFGNHRYHDQTETTAK